MRDQAIASQRAREEAGQVFPGVAEQRQMPVQTPVQGATGPRMLNGQVGQQQNPQQQAATDALQALAGLLSDESTGPPVDRQWLSDAERSELDALEARRQELLQPEPRRGFWKALGEGALGQFAHGNPWALETQREGRRQKALDIVDKQRGDIEARRKAIQERHDQRILNQWRKSQTLGHTAKAFADITPPSPKFSLTEWVAVAQDGTSTPIQEDESGNIRLVGGGSIPETSLVRKRLSKEAEEREEIFGAWYAAVGANEDATWPLSNKDKLKARDWRASTEYRPQTNLEAQLDLIKTDPALFAAYKGNDKLTPFQRAQVIGATVVRAQDRVVGDLTEEGYNQQVEIMQNVFPDFPFPTWDQINAEPEGRDIVNAFGKSSLKNEELVSKPGYDFGKQLDRFIKWLRGIEDNPESPEAGIGAFPPGSPEEARKFRDEYRSLRDNGNGAPGPIGSNTLPPGLPRELQGSGGLGGMSQQQTGLAMQARPLQRRNTLTGQLEYSIDGGEEWHLGPMPTATA